MGPDLLQFIVTTGIIGSIITAASVIVQVILNKRLRTPADRQSEISNVFSILNGTIQDNRADKEANEKTIGALREYVDKLEDASRDDQTLIRSLYGTIHELEERNAEKDRRIAELEAQIAKYAEILSKDPTLLDEDLENTQNPFPLR